jgi:hypothetical protein
VRISLPSNLIQRHEGLAAPTIRTMGRQITRTYSFTGSIFFLSPYEDLAGPQRAVDCIHSIMLDHFGGTGYGETVALTCYVGISTQSRRNAGLVPLVQYDGFLTSSIMNALNDGVLNINRLLR